MEIMIQGRQRGYSAALAWPTTRALGGRKAPTAGRQADGGRMHRF